jgi:hypothetical protein
MLTTLSGPAWKSSSEARAGPQQRLAINPKATTTATITRPQIPARRSWFIMTPMRLSRKPSGVASSTVNPPRVEMGDAQPGLPSIKAARATTAARDKYSPIRPTPAFRWMAGSAWIMGGSCIAQSWTGAGWLVVWSGLRLNSTFTVTFLPSRFLGTRHEYEHVPPHPNSRLPLATWFPFASVTVKVGLDGCSFIPAPLA